MKKSFYSRYSFTIVLVVAFLAPFAVGGARRAMMSNANDVKSWLPSKYDETREYNEFRKQFSGEQFILVSWDGCRLDDGRLRMMAAKLDPTAQRYQSGDERPLFDEIISGPSLIERLTNPPSGLPKELALERLQGSLIGPDGQTTCMVLIISEAGKEDPHAVVDTIYNVAQNECGIPPAELHMGGAASDNVAIDVAGEASLVRLAGMAGVIGLVISWWCLRSIQLVIMVLSVGIYSAAASLALVWYTGSHVDAIVLTMPSLVYVASISGAIHLANYYRDSIHEEGLEGAPGRAIRHAALPLVLATGTTAVGLFSLCWSELVPIQKFGFYSALGVMVSAAFLFLYMPAMFEMWPLREEPRSEKEAEARSFIDPAFFKGWKQLGEAICTHNRLVVAVGVALLIFCGIGLTKMKTSVQLMRLFSPEAKVITDYKWLESNLGPLVPMEIVVRFDKKDCDLTFLERMELVEKVERAVEAIDGDLPEKEQRVGSAMSAVTFAPPLPGTEEAQAAETPKRPSRGFGRMGQIVGRIAVRDRERLERDVRNTQLEEHRDDFMQGDYLTETDTEELWRVSARISALQDVDYAKFVSDLRENVEPVIEAERASGKHGIDTTYTGLVPLVYKAQNSLLNGLVTGFAMDLVLIIAAIMVALRAFSAGVVLALPCIFPPVIIFGAMGWLGIIIDIGTVMTPAVALGVSVDDIVHFMLQFRRALTGGASRKEAVMTAYHHLGRPMYQSWGVIGLGLSVFALSPFTPTERFGYMMIALLTASLAGSLIFLPAILMGPMGSWFARTARRQDQLKAQKDRSRVPPPKAAHNSDKMSEMATARTR